MTITAHTIDAGWNKHNFILETRPVTGVGDEANEPQRTPPMPSESAREGGGGMGTL